ncbi:MULTISPECIES: CaiB/BaiF CoA transferase family protein [Chelativorans]|jgi:crotonobetainyl-CoA:carnitine CoA-transferase CaiB-like acyl-CoA transferase|uniref:L-carnitine dehydratase/bile acid-inducible protein F n=1 Tax=Chelativorans sp. (strain BNC1) TaxID=266779 RepID=Q11D68_CHESB|nr:MULTISPECIES: CoA transferase [Chelativorans]
MTDIKIAPGPLSGIRVLDFTSVLSGPYCTRLLADLGAEVLKIEPPEGDHKRLVPPLRSGHGSTFAHVNSGKKSVVLDLKSPEGAQAACELSARSAVVVQNWRPDVAVRLGLDYAALSKENPALVYCAISGYGQEGERAMRPAYAPIVHAASGYELAQMQYQPGATEPAATGIFIADIFAGMSAFGAINAALLRRQRTGRGQFIDVSMYDGMLNLLMFEWHQAQFFEVPRRIYPPLRASDGFIVVAPVTQRNFHALADCIGRPEIKSDPRFSSPSARVSNWQELMVLAAEWVRERTAQECEELMTAHQVPCARYRTVAESLSDPALAERGSLATVVDGAGDVLIPTAPWQMPGVDARPRTDVPALGASTEEVLSELLGYGKETIRACQGSRTKEPPQVAPVK